MGAGFLALLFVTVAIDGRSQDVVRISGEVRFPAEVSVGINPENPGQVIVVGLGKPVSGKPRVSNYAFISADAGRTWETVAAANPDGRVQGDDAVTFRDDGLAVHAYIAFSGLRAKHPKRARNGIFVTTSRDHGETWSPPVPVVDHINTLMPFEDKPYLVSDNSPRSPFHRNIYLAWTRFDIYGSSHPADSTQIFFSRSTDSAATFSTPLRISDRGGDCLDGDNTVEGAVPVVGTAGEVYVVWAGPLGLVLDKSLDGGATFGADKVIGPIPGGWSIDVPGLGRSNGMPVTAVDHSTGPYRGTLYVNWVDTRHGDPDVFLMYSRDAGETWSDAVRVNDDPVHNGKEQFFTWMAVDPQDGSVNIVYLDRRNARSTETAVFLARSVDGGHSFTNTKIALPEFQGDERVFFGDYIGIDAYGGRVVCAFPYFQQRRELAVYAALFRF